MYIEHTIDENSLHVIPLDGLVLNMLPVHDKDKNSINDTSSTIGSQETETGKLPQESEISQGPEQGGATGTNFLVEDSYFEPKNLNNEEEEKNRISNIVCTPVGGTKENPIAWPTQSKL